eukprot:TRINITY_DN17306_c0_g1_i1.p2 TRINITY_DN17306_c0_g1~~TRINITY_DN17306_c0_g1_i1.p2  ORF type:complete len:102 (+),score=1.36 TRINITY_DN17306_c0_g1_i1:256-561(+)
MIQAILSRMFLEGHGEVVSGRLGGKVMKCWKVTCDSGESWSPSEEPFWSENRKVGVIPMGHYCLALWPPSKDLGATIVALMIKSDTRLATGVYWFPSEAPA